MFVLQLEPALQRFFGQWGVVISRSPWRIIGPMVVMLIAITFGLFALERENDAIDLWIADRGRIKDEVSFYRDNFEELSPNLQALIVQPKEGKGKVSLLDPRALKEVVELQEWVMQHEYVHKFSERKKVALNVTLGDICFKPVDRDDREPCFQYSILDCFREGNVFTPGGTMNSAYSGIYSPRPSFTEFNFKKNFTEEFIRSKCVQWYNLGTADTMFLGGITKGKNSEGESTVVDVEALRIVFGTKSEEQLFKDGVKKIVWTPKTATGASGLDLCRDPLDCAECSEEVGLADAAAAGCIPRPGAQTKSCCDFMAELRDVECVNPLFEEDPSLGNLANIVFEGCGIPTVQLTGSCNNEELFLEEVPEAQRLAQEDSATETEDSGTEAEDSGTEEEDSGTEAPPVCICLVDRESEECTTAATNFAIANTEYLPIFTDAQTGDTAALKELRDLLLSPEVGCPAEDSPKSNAGAAPKKNSPPDVCICLTESGSPECEAAGRTFVGENPEYLTSFLNAAGGNETAVQEVARILVEDVECPVGGKRRRKLLQANDDGDGPLQVCACLEARSGAECAEGGIAFVQANPEYANIFRAASDGDAEASLEVARIIQEEGNCAETKYSFKVDRTNFRNEDMAWELLHGWEKAWRRDIKEKVKKFEYIDVAWVSSSSVTDETEKAAKGQLPLITAGYIMVGAYIFLYFMLDFDGGTPKFSHSPPGPFIAIVGYVCVLLSVAATFGIIGILSLSPMKTSPITMQIVPLLMVGLGVNDFFVIASYLKSSVQSQSAPTLSKLLYDTMAGGGTSITLSSLTNMAAFALGSLSPIPAVQWFTIHMMIGVFVAYCVSITVIPAILTIGASRYLDAKNDCCLLCLGDPKTGASATEKKNPAGMSVPGEKIAMLLTVIVFAVFGAWLGISIWGITRLELGLPASQLVQENSDLYKFLKPSEDHFQTFPLYTVYRGGKTLGELQTISDIRATEYNFTIDAYKMDKYYRATSWVNYYAEYVESKFCSNTICMDQIEWFWDGFFSEEYGTEDVCKGLPGGKKACEEACSQRCPQGPLGSPFRCKTANNGKSCFCPYRPKLKEEFFFESPEGYSGSPSYWSDFMANSTGGSISKNLIVFDESTRNKRNIFGIPAGFRSLSIVENVDTIDEKVKHINSGRKVTDRGPIEDAFPFDFLVYGVGEQYKDLGVKAAIAIAISIAVTLIVMMPLIVHWLAAVIVAACVLSAVVLTAGTSHWFGIGLNHSLYVSLVVTVGLSIEFCAHIARDFMLAEGTPAQRVHHALYSLGLAVFNGGITTFLGILPLSWAKYNYFQRYFFGLYALVVAVGLFVGLLLMPAVLYWLGPKSAAKVDASVQKGMEMVGKGKPGAEA